LSHPLYYTILYYISGGQCLFGKQCWFKHDEIETRENSEVMQKMLDFMEKITERITNLEKKVDTDERF
jgi:hypothetical protein